MNNLESFEEEAGALATTVRRYFPDPPLTIRLALSALLSGQNNPARAATVNAIAPGHSASPVLGAALELMNTSLHTLHEGLDRPSRQHFCLNTAGDILSGDYLSSAAFRLLVQVDSLPVMDIVSKAIQRACEIEIARLDNAGGKQASHPTLGLSVYQSAASLGGAAGATAALLAGHEKCAGDQASQFGRFFAIAVDWTNRMRRDACPEQSKICRSLAIEALNEAESAAIAFAGRTRNQLPVTLCQRFREHVMP